MTVHALARDGPYSPSHLVAGCIPLDRSGSRSSSASALAARARKVAAYLRAVGAVDRRVARPSTYAAHVDASRSYHPEAALARGLMDDLVESPSCPGAGLYRISGTAVKPRGPAGSVSRRARYLPRGGQGAHTWYGRLSHDFRNRLLRAGNSYELKKSQQETEPHRTPRRDRPRSDPPGRDHRADDNRGHMCAAQPLDEHGRSRSSDRGPGSLLPTALRAIGSSHS